MFHAFHMCFIELWPCFVRKRIDMAQCQQAGRKEGITVDLTLFVLPNTNFCYLTMTKNALTVNLYVVFK